MTDRVRRVVARNDELEAAIRANPDSPDAYLVYGDWLLESGDPLGELVSLQTARAKNPNSAALKKRERMLLAQHGPAWLGPFAGDEHTWAYGFLRSLSLSEPSAERLSALLGLGAARFLRELDVELSHDRRTNMSFVLGMAELGVPATLRALGLVTVEDDPHEVELGDVSEIYRHLGSLRELVVRASGIAFGEIELPSLRSFALTGAFPSESLLAFAAARWRALESFALTWTRRMVDERSVRRVIAMFERPEAPRLRHLGIAGSAHGDALLRTFAESPLTRALASIDLSRSAITDEGAKILLDRCAAFLHIESIDLRENDLSDDMRDKLQEVYGIAVDTDGVDDSDDEDRYDDVDE